MVRYIPLPVLLLGACVPRLYSGDTGGMLEPWEAPKNTWPASTPPEGLAGDGCAEGDILDEFRLPDQHGDEVSLWQFYGDVVIVDVSTMWCGPCQELAHDVQITADDYRDQGVTYLTVLSQDLNADPPDTDELNQWGDTFGILEPIVSDLDGWSECLVPGEDFPAVFLVDRDMRVLGRVQPVSDELLRDALDEVL